LSWTWRPAAVRITDSGLGPATILIVPFSTADMLGRAEQRINFMARHHCTGLLARRTRTLWPTAQPEATSRSAPWIAAWLLQVGQAA
jgi:hypothetical protein